MASTSTPDRAATLTADEPAPGPPAVHKVAFTTYPVTDVARARSFYEEQLGLPVGMAGGRGDMWWVEYDLPGGGCLAISNATGRAPSADAGAMVALEVSDLDGMMRKLESGGVVFKSGVIHGPRCRMAVCLDTEGNALMLHQLTAGATTVA